MVTALAPIRNSRPNKKTFDRVTGRPFRYNTTVLYETASIRGKAKWRVPAYMTSESAEHLHPDRVDQKLLKALNPDLVCKTCGHFRSEPDDPAFRCWCDDCKHYARIPEATFA